MGALSLPTSDARICRAALRQPCAMCMSTEPAAPTPVETVETRAPNQRGVTTTRRLQCYWIFSKIIVAWIRSPPPTPLLPEAAVVIVCSRYPKEA